MWVSSGLLTDSQDDRASPWDVVAIVLQVVGPMDRLTVYLAVGGGKRHPVGESAADEDPVVALEFSRSCALVQRGIGIDRQTIVARIMKAESHPWLSLFPILLERQRQWQSSIGEMELCLGFRNHRRRCRGIWKLSSALL